MRTLLYAILSAAIATAAHGQVSGTITDLGRDGAPDLITQYDNIISLSEETEVRFINEFAVPGPREEIRWMELACQAAGGWWPPEPRFELALYVADGVITEEDYGREPAFVFETVRVRTWEGRYELRVEARAQIEALIGAGASTLGVRVRLLDPHPRATYNMYPSHDRILDTGQSCAPCYADFDGSGGVDVDDIVFFFQAWQFGAPCADVDRSGGVDGDDVTRFFRGWTSGGCA